MLMAHAMEPALASQDGEAIGLRALSQPFEFEFNRGRRFMGSVERLILPGPWAHVATFSLLLLAQAKPKGGVLGPRPIDGVPFEWEAEIHPPAASTVQVKQSKDSSVCLEVEVKQLQESSAPADREPGTSPEALPIEVERPEPIDAASSDSAGSPPHPSPEKAPKSEGKDPALLRMRALEKKLSRLQD